MKKISFLMCALFALLLKVNAQEPQFVSTEKQNRNVLIEEFTGRDCGYCPDGHLIANNIVNSNPGRVWAVNIHSGGYAATDYPNFITEDGDIIRTTIHNGGYPSGAVNRSTTGSLSRGEWSTKTTQQLSQSAECNIAGQVVINSETRLAMITVEVYYTGNSLTDKNYLTVMMLQDNIVGSQSGSYYNPSQVVSGGYNHMHVLRDVITPTWGDEIAPTTAGTLITKVYSYEIPQIIGSPSGVTVDLNNINFIAFVTERQDGTATRPMLNVNELSKGEGFNVEVTTTVNPENAGVVSGAGTYSYGDNIVLKATPNAGYKFSNWTVNGEVVSKDAEYTFRVIKDIDLVANFIPENSYFVTTSVNPKDAGVITGAALYNLGETATLVATPNEGYRFVNWTENGVSVSTDAQYSFEITGDRELVANFTLLDYGINVSLNPENGGAVAVTFFEENFEEGQLPKGWDAYNEDATNPADKPSEEQEWVVDTAYSGVAPMDGEYYAVSASKWYYNDARLYLVTPKVAVPSEAVMQFNYVNPKRKKEDGAEYSSRLYLYVSDSPIGPWTELWSTRAGKSTSKWTNVKVDMAEYAGQELYFAFCNKFSGYGSWTAVDDVVMSGSVVDATGKDRNYTHGDNVTFVATPNEGYKFIGWMEDGTMVSTDNKYSFTVTSSRNLVATFMSEAQKLVTATVNPTEAGLVTGAGVYEENDTVTLTATANEGYKFLNWTENEAVVSEDSVYSFVVTSDRDFVANFESLNEEPETPEVSSAPLTFKYEGDSVASGVTIDIVSDINSSMEIQFDLDIINTTNADIKVVAQMEDLTGIGSTYLCWGNCYQPGVLQAENVVKAGNKGVFNGHVMFVDANYLPLPEGSEIKMVYTFFDERNPEEKYVFNVNFKYDTDENPGDTITFVITAVANPEEAGVITGAGTFKENDTVTLTATANEGYKFVRWTENNMGISTDAEYSFVATSNRNLVAKFEKIAGVEEHEASFNIYPNPVSDKLYIETLTQTLTVEIYDIYGRQQSMVNGQQPTVIDVTNLNSGVYFVKVVTSEGETVKRFIKK